jgi:erythromycin esterase-like protein
VSETPASRRRDARNAANATMPVQMPRRASTRTSLTVCAIVLLAGCAGSAGSTSLPSVAVDGPESQPPAPASHTNAATSDPAPAAGDAAVPSTGAAMSPAAFDVAEVAAVAAAARPLRGDPDDHDELLARMGDADVVLLGEPSHGTHEVYAERAEITRRLIEEAGFSGVAIEGDWPDAWRADRYVRGIGEDATPAEALAEFDAFPEWMWRNEVVADLVGWLRERNAGLPYAEQAGIYGLDLYSLPESTVAVAEELRPIDAAAAAQADRRYACTGVTAFPAPHDETTECSEHVREALREAQAVLDAVPEGRTEEADRAFSAAQNARIVVNGRRYTLGEGAEDESSWNIRDRHMAETLWSIRDHLRETGRSGRLVVWAHDSHIGDARATEVAERGQLNLGQLVRERSGVRSFLLGFSTYTGCRRAIRRCSTRSPVSATTTSSSSSATMRRRRSRPSAWSGTSASSTARRPSG